MARWETDIDNSTEMMRCSVCGNRVIKAPYLLAIGTKAMRCPYCGERMENGKVVEWPIVRLGKRRTE